jgi:hypothetical protein
VRAGRRAGGWAVLAAAALPLAFPPPRLPAQVAGDVASLPGSTRSAGLAGAGVALVGDAGSIFANPAAIAAIRHVALEGSYEEYPAGATLSSVAAAVGIGPFAYGIGAHVLRPAPATGEPTDVLALTALVFRFGMIALGTSFKYVREGFAVPRVEAWAGDAGVAIALFDIFALGASVENLGGDVAAGAHLPRRTRAGFTMNFADPQGSGRLLTTIEGQWPEGRPSVLVVGAEGGFVTSGGVGLIGRMGVSGRTSSIDMSPFAAGAGVSLGRLQLDYAYRSYSAPRGAMHRLGVRWTR